MSDLSLWLPDGRGVVDIRVWRAQLAVREYDPRLVIGQDQESGQWAVYIQLERGTLPEMGDLYPIFGLGHDVAEFPHPEDLKARLWRSDTVRHGDEMLDRLNRNNEQLRKERESATNEGIEAAAEAMAWGQRRLSNDISRRKVQVHMGEPVHRRRPESK